MPYDEWRVKSRSDRLAMTGHMIVRAQMAEWDALSAAEKRQRLSDYPRWASLVKGN